MQPATGSLLHIMTMLAIVIYIAAGAIGLVSGTVAACARKGGVLHRGAGNVFFVSMVVLSVFAAYLGFAVPGQKVNIFISAFTCYLVVTAWMTARHKADAVGPGEKIALFVGLVLCAPFVMLSFQLAIGMTPMIKTAVPFKGPVLVAIYSFTSVLVIAAIGDVKVVLSGGISGAPRIARHLWRMCLGLTLAAGSAFTNGLARFLPGPYHVPTAFFLPQFLPLGLLIFWMIRVRFTGWFRRNAVA